MPILQEDAESTEVLHQGRNGSEGIGCGFDLEPQRPAANNHGGGAVAPVRTADGALRITHPTSIEILANSSEREQIDILRS